MIFYIRKHRQGGLWILMQKKTWKLSFISLSNCQISDVYNLCGYDFQRVKFYICYLHLTSLPKHFFVFKAECEIIACQFYFFISKKDIVVFPKGLQNPTLGFVTPNTVAYTYYFLLLHSTISLTQRSTHQLL